MSILIKIRRAYIKMFKRILCVITVALWCVACQSALQTGRSQFIVVSEAQEQQMGEEAYLETLKKSRVSTRSDRQAQFASRRPTHRRGGG